MELEMPIVMILELGYSVRLKISNINSLCTYSPLNKLSSSSINKNIRFRFFLLVKILLNNTNYSLIELGITSLNCLRIDRNIVIGVLYVIAFSSIQTGLYFFTSFWPKNLIGFDFISLSIWDIRSVFPPPGVPEMNKFYLFLAFNYL